LGKESVIDAVSSMIVILLLESRILGTNDQ
jgi:hypothetical protein